MFKDNDIFALLSVSLIFLRSESLSLFVAGRGFAFNWYRRRGVGGGGKLYYIKDKMMVSFTFLFHGFSISFFSAVPDEMIARLFAAFVSLKQKIVFKFDSIKVNNVFFLLFTIMLEKRQ